MNSVFEAGARDGIEKTAGLGQRIVDAGKRAWRGVRSMYRGKPGGGYVSPKAQKSFAQAENIKRSRAKIEAAKGSPGGLSGALSRGELK